MVQKGNLVVFESSGISETGETMPTKIGLHDKHTKNSKDVCGRA